MNKADESDFFRYDKLQIIVCANGEAGINFEHTGVDGRECGS